MRIVLALVMIANLANCQRITEEDKVRKARRLYEVTQDFTVDTEDNVSVEMKVQNKSGGKTLQEITFNAEAVDAQDQVFWSEQFVLDVTGLGDMATKTEILKWQVPDANAKLDGLRVVMAPDNEGSNYKSYKEFMRVQ